MSEGGVGRVHWLMVFHQKKSPLALPFLAVLGGKGTVQFLYDAARGQLRVHGAQVRRAGRGEYLPPECVFGEGKVPRQGGRRWPHVVALGAFKT